ncbi:MAG: DUF2612 domain-containing protein [Elusimicrobia bacterium]|nr:DUF2612 domain-containing protein [Elusimicrobiota bacterium]
MNTSELIAYYASLLIIQYRMKPKAQATVVLMAAEAIADQLFSAVRDGFDVLTAVGAQLDILARYVGAQRGLYGLDLSKTWFSMPLSTDADHDTVPGFATVDTSPVQQYFITVPDFNVLTTELNDGELSLLIQYLAAVASCDYALATVDAICMAFFGAGVTVTDNGDMTMTYTYAADLPNGLFHIVNYIHKLPKPAGVAVIVEAAA